MLVDTVRATAFVINHVLEEYLGSRAHNIFPNCQIVIRYSAPVQSSASYYHCQVRASTRLRHPMKAITAQRRCSRRILSDRQLILRRISTRLDHIEQLAYGRDLLAIYCTATSNSYK